MDIGFTGSDCIFIDGVCGAGFAGIDGADTARLGRFSLLEGVVEEDFSLPCLLLDSPLVSVAVGSISARVNCSDSPEEESISIVAFSSGFEALEFSCLDVELSEVCFVRTAGFSGVLDLGVTVGGVTVGEGLVGLFCSVVVAIVDTGFAGLDCVDEEFTVVGRGVAASWA
nr:hypothetical protein [Bartonella sp. DB5-6]